ncbi:MAG: leucine-rich repeat protein, partial [Kiritimatiellae bacterium]|nr:leucine-rich repeat protein [Kiritimatiellia bacterium]
MNKQQLLCGLLSLLMCSANAAWIFDSSARTLTNSESSVVIKNVSASGTNLTINQQAYSTDTYEYGMLDFNSEAIVDANGQQYDLVALGNSAFQHCKGITGFIAPPTLTTLNERSFQGSGIFTFDISQTTNFTFWGGAMFQDAFNLTGDIYLPDTITTFGSWAFHQAGIDSTGFSVYFGASIAPTVVDQQGQQGGMFFRSNVEVVDFSKLTRIKFVDHCFRSTPKLKKVLLPEIVDAMPQFSFNCHTKNYPLLEVYFKNCPFTVDNIAKNPFCEMFNGGEKYTVSEANIAATTNIVIYVPRFSNTSISPNWNKNATAWEELAANSPKWRTDNSTPIFTLPTTPDGEGLYVTDYSKTGYSWNDGVVRVKFWEDPNQIEFDASKPACYEELVNVSPTNVSLNVIARNIPEKATKLYVTLAIYADAEHTQLVASKNGALTRENISVYFDFNDLNPDAPYFFTMSCVDNQQSPVQGDLVDLGLLNSWLYDEEAKTLTLSAKSEVASVVIENVTADGSDLTIGNNKLCKYPNIDLSCHIYGDYKIVKIDSNAFQNSLILTRVILPEELTIIQESVFDSCSNLEYVEGINVKAIQNNAFRNCFSLKQFKVEELYSVNNGGFQACYVLTDFGPANAITNIGNDAFVNCNSLSKDLALTSPELTKIGRYAFAECHKITSVTLGENVVDIGEKAFFKTYAVSNVVFQSNDIENISTTAFGGHGVINNSSAAELKIYMTNVPTTLKNFLTETHAQAGPTDAQIAAADTIVTMYIPYYDGVIKDAENGISRSGKFAANALEWQNADIPALVGDGSTFILPTDEKDTGIWYNKHNNWGGYIV